MPLPAYITQQPTISPIDVISRRIASSGAELCLSRMGSTIAMGRLDAPDDESCCRAIRLVQEHADQNQLTIEATVPDVLAGTVRLYERAGFNIVHQTDEDDMDGAHYLLRRPARR